MLDTSTDFTVYRRSGYDPPQLNTSDLVWNMRLSKSFHKGRWTVALDGFDLLHQLTNVRYSVSPSGRIESYSNTLPRYVLLHALPGIPRDSSSFPEVSLGFPGIYRNSPRFIEIHP